MKNPNTTIYPNNGFTLVEMAIVLAIVALLLGGLLPVISSQIEQQRRNETRKYMDEVRDAMLGFAVSNGRLPCPDTSGEGVEDTGTITTDNIPIAGQSTKATSCTVSVGSLPYNTLGVSPIDSYNSALIYALTPAFGARTEVYSAPAGGGTLLSSSFFNLSSTGAMQICNASCAANLTTTAVAVIVSRGTNWATATSPDETENTNSDPKFISRDFAQNGYDDLVVWLSPNTLFNRMVTAGKLP